MEINSNFSANAKRDFNLVERAKEGDQKAYADLMERYQDSIYFMALKMVNNKDDAMDITVETFGKAFKNINKYKPDYSFSTWVFKIATNNCIDFLRKKKLNLISIEGENQQYGNNDQLQIKSDLLNPEETSIKKQQKEQLKFVIEQLPARYRILIIMYYYEDYTYEQISAALDIPTGTIKGRLFRARDLMLNILNQQQKFTL